MQNNDWLATLMFNPDKDINNLKTAGLTPDNTKLKSKEYYLDLPEIKESFKTEAGDFDSQSFDQYYNSALRLYNNFVSDELNDKLFNDYIYSPIDLTRDKDSKVFTPSFTIKKIPNPMAKTYGVSSLFGEGTPQRSMREAAQTQKVYNWETKEFENWTPNDDDKRGIFDFWGTPTLVEATWDEDGTHIENGREVRHYKGMQKLNADGMPYYETLGNRDVSSKRVLHLSDTLTIDGSDWNKVDIFDNDGIDKSVTGTTMNIVANVVPLFIPYIGPMYKWATIGLGLSKALGTFGKSTSDLFYGEKPKLWEYFNNLDSFSARLDSSVSDYGSENPFSWEGIGNIIKDSIKQLYQQREIAKASLSISSLNQKKFLNSNNQTYLSKFGKTFEEALKDGDVDKEFFKAFSAASGVNTQKINKVARDMSSMYMALTQSADVYNTMKEANFSPEYTAVGMIASLVGFKKIMDSELGDVALQGLGITETKLATKQFLKEYLGDVRKALSQSDLTTKAGKFAAIKNISNIFEKGIKAINATPILASSAKEGLEEVSEELLQDSILGMLTAVDRVFSDGTNANYVPWENNALERYGTAFLGGVIGGAIFKGVELSENRAAGLTKAIPNSALRNLETVLRNGGADEVLELVDKQIRSGKIASTSLSMEIDENASTSKETIFKVASNRENSQNDVIGGFIKNYIRAVNSFITEEGLSLTDSQIIDAALGRDTRLTALARNGIDKDILNDFTGLLTNIVSLRSELSSTKDSDKDKISEVQSKLTAAQNEVREFLDGGNKNEYLEEMLFQLNRTINLPYTYSDIYMYAMSKGKNYSLLSEEEKKLIDKEYKELRENIRGNNKFAFKTFKNIRQSIQSDLSSISDAKNKDLVKYKEFINTELNKLNESLGTLTKDERLSIRDRVSKEFLKDASLDEAISSLGLNTKEDKLSDSQKVDLLNNYVESSLIYKNLIEEETFKKRTENVSVQPGIGIDSDLIIRTNTDIAQELSNLKALVNILQQAKERFGFIDENTASKVNSILNYYDNINVVNSLKGVKISDIKNKISGSVDLLGKYTTYIPSLTIGNEDLLVDYFVTNTKLSYNEDTDSFELSFYINPKTIGQLKEVLDFGEEELELSDGTIVNVENMLNKGIFTYSISPESVSNLITEEINMSKDLNSWSTLMDKGNSKLIQDILIDNMYNERLGLINNARSIQGGLVASNPVMKALDSISKILSGESITKVILSEESNYRSLSNIDDYVISNNITEQQLRTLDTAVDILKSQLMASMTDDENLFDFNRILNSARKSLGLDELATLDTSTIMAAIQDLSRIQTKVNYLIALHENNAGSKLQNSKKTSLRINTMLALILSKGNLPPLTYTNPDGEELNFLDLKDVLSEVELERLESIYNSSQLSDENYKFVVESLYKVKDEMYNRFQALDEDTKESLISKIASDAIFKRDFSHDTDIKRNSTPDDLSVGFIADYIFMSMVSDPKDFLAKFKAVCIENPSQYAPFAGQMLDIEFNWCMLTHTDELNSYLKGIIKGTSNEDIKNNYNFIPNTVFNLGDPGSGKTTAVAWFTNQMLKQANPDIKVWCSAPKRGMAEKLASLLGYNNIYSKDELFNSILTDSGKAKYQNIKEYFKTGKAIDGLIEEGSTDKLNVDFFNSDDFESDVPDIIFIDEITHFNFMETTLLGNIKSKSGINPKIVALGDPNQSGAEDSKGIPISGDQGIGFSSPNLNMSVRADNTTKQDNLSKMSTMLKNVLKQMKISVINNIKFDPTQFIKSINTDLTIKYFQKNSELHGEKVVKSRALKSEISNLMSNLEDGERIALITDKLSGELVDLFNSFNSDKLVIVNENDVQGSEYKYTVIDVEWKKIDTSAKASDFVSELKRAYTLLTRSSVGTIIVDENEHSLFNNNEKTEVSKKVDIDSNDVTEYSKFILSSLAGIGDNKTQEKEQEESSQSTESVESTTEQSDTEIAQVNTVTEEVTLVEVTPQMVRKAESELAEKSKIPNDFLGSHLVAYSGFYFNGNSLEDINGLENNGQTDKANKTGLVVLKSLLLNKRDRIEKLLNSPVDSLFTSIYRTFAQKYFPSSSFENSIKLFKQAILNGNFAIKIKKAESGDIPYNRPEIKGSKDGENDFRYPVMGDILTKLVYRIPLEDGKSFDISIGFIGDKDIPNNVNEVLDRMKRETGNSGAVNYLNFNKNYEFTIRGIDIRPGLDINGNLIDEKKNTKSGSRETRMAAMNASTVAKLKQSHPELNISDPIVLTEDMKKNQENNAFFVKRGQPVVLVSRDLFLTQEQMLSRFTEYAKNGNIEVLDGITPVWVTPIGISTGEFLHTWKKLYHSSVGTIQKMGHHYLGGYMQGPRFLNVLVGVKRYLTDPLNYSPDFKKRAQSYWPRREQLNKLITGDINTVPSSSEAKTYLESLNRVLTVLRAFVVTTEQSSTGLPINYSRLSPKSLGLNKEQLAILEKTIEEKSKESVPFMAALESLKDLNSTFKEMYNAFSEINTSQVIFSDKITKLFEMGILPPIVAGVEIIDTIASAYSRDENFRNILDYAIESSPQFVGGIQLNHINSIEGITSENGIVDSGLTDSELYVDQYIGNPRFYLDFSSLSLDETINTETEEKANATTTSSNSFNTSNILNSLKNTVNLYYDKFEGKSFKTFNSKMMLDINSVVEGISNKEEAIKAINLYLDKNYSLGGLYDDDGNLVAVLPKITVLEDESVELSKEERTANKVFSGYSALLVKSIQANTRLRIATQAFNSKSSNSIVSYLKFLSPRYFAIKLNDSIYTGELKLEGGNSVFKLHTPNGELSKNLRDTYSDILEKLPNYNKC